VADPATGEIWTVPREGAALYSLSPGAAGWERHSRPAGYCQHMAMQQGRVFLVAGG
jgi:hypothetical protein